jgi:hypothetical protein
MKRLKHRQDEASEVGNEDKQRTMICDTYRLRLYTPGAERYIYHECIDHHVGTQSRRTQKSSRTAPVDEYVALRSTHLLQKLRLRPFSLETNFYQKTSDQEEHSKYEEKVHLIRMDCLHPANF